jgi:hypothetical protein
MNLDNWHALLEAARTEPIGSPWPTIVTSSSTAARWVYYDEPPPDPPIPGATQGEIRLWHLWTDTPALTGHGLLGIVAQGW